MNMRIIGFITLVAVLFLSLFKIKGAELSNNVLGLCLMILLVILFTDLSEFNFWGLIGKKSKEEENIKNLKDADPITANPPEKDEIQNTAQQIDAPIQLMDTPTGNFLELSFEIERLLRLAAASLMQSPIPPDANNLKIVKMLRDKGLLTESGEQQVASIRWLRNMIVHGRKNEVNEETIRAGIDLAWKFYSEIKGWLDGTNQQQTTS